MKHILRPIAVGGFIFLLSAIVFAENGKIQGKVKEENGKALAGVLVTATRTVTRSLDNKESEKNTYEAKTDEKGEFLLSGLPAGSYTLNFEREGFKTAVTLQRIELKDGEFFKYPKPFELKRVESPYGWIRGAVLDSSGFSLPNIRITIERVDGKKFKKIEKVSSDGGEFGFRVPGEKGTYRLTAEADGFAKSSKEVTIDGDEIRQVILQLEKK